MTFSRFSHHLAKIDATTKRLEMTDLLVSLLKESSPNEIDKVVYLSLGQLAPLYAHKEFGLAEKMVARAITQAFDVSIHLVTREFKKTGDLGTVAEQLKREARSVKREGGSNLAPRASRLAPLSVTDVFEKLTAIAEDSGEKSQERKLTATAALLQSLDPLSVKFVTRIIIDNLRLGFSDKTVLDALSILVAGDKSARIELEAAYNVRPDVGTLARELRMTNYELRSLRRVSPQLGTPVLPALCQRLPSTEEIIEKMGEVAVEPKWDGQRIQAHVRLNANSKLKTQNSKLANVRLFTRSLEDVTDMFPDLIDAVKKLMDIPSSFSLHPSSLILDGEIVGIDPKNGRVLPFQTMITRKRKYGVQEQLLSVPIRYMVFDILMKDGKSLLNEPFSERRRMLETLFTRHQALGTRHHLALALQIITNRPDDIRSFLKTQLDAGLEGIVAKKWDSSYSPGRTGFHWVKLKWEGGAKAGGLLDTVDCVVMGTYAGRGKRSGFGVGAFLVGVLSSPGTRRSSRGLSPEGHQAPDTFLTISKIGTGLSDEQWRELQAKSEKRKAKSQPKEYDVPKQLVPDMWLRPELVAEIQADNITKSPLHTAGYALRFPRLVRYRTDKKPTDATTIEEVLRLFKLQK